MRKIGTLSAALGLIFMGVWIIIRNIDDGLAGQLFKWWPMIIILTGIEILYFLKVTPNEKMGFNWLVLVIVVVFVAVSGAQHVNSRFDRIFEQGKTISMFDSHKAEYKAISTVKNFSVANQEIVLAARNGNFNVRKSQDNQVKIEAEIYVDKASSLEKWDMQTVPSTNEVRVNLKDGVIKEVYGDIYVPEGCSVRFEVDNFKITTSGVDLTNFSVDSQNAYLDMRNNIKNLRVNIQNGKIDSTGNIENIELKLQSGKIDINNKNEKSVTIKMDNGVLSYNTNNRDASVNVNVNHGVGMVNERKVAKGTTEIFGGGASIFNLKVDNGTIRFLNQE